MFWGCFSGTAGKGPGIFWEKNWGTITAETYSQYIVPIIDGWIRMHPDHIFMHKNAPGHAHETTVEELKSRGIRILIWPPFSPDQNPIKTVWDKMKDYIALNFPEKMTHDRLRMAVKEAWEKGITEEYFHSLLEGMQKRYKDVILAQGGHTKN
jgi:hypothetical protein